VIVDNVAYGAVELLAISGHDQPVWQLPVTTCA
jgi:hypothetical protein